MFRKKKNEPAEEKKDKTQKNEQSKEQMCCDCQQLQELKEKFIRVSADLQNYRKRVEKEKAQWIKIAQSELLTDLLSVVDDFDRALQESKKEGVPKELSVFVDGLEMIYKSFYKFFDKYGIKEITEIKIFDPNLHEAISQIDSPDHQSGEIIQVLQKGFMLKDNVLRPAKVVVAK